MTLPQPSLTPTLPHPNLQVSSAFEATAAAHALLEAGAKLGLRDSRLETPLHKVGFLYSAPTTLAPPVMRS